MPCSSQSDNNLQSLWWVRIYCASVFELNGSGGTDMIVTVTGSCNVLIVKESMVFIETTSRQGTGITIAKLDFRLL